MKRYNVVEMTTSASVFSGPGTSVYYKKIGTIYPGDEVWIYTKEGNWYYVEYPIGNGKWKCGYAIAGAFVDAKNYDPSLIETPVLVNAGPRYVNKDADTYFGYNATFPVASTLRKGTEVQYLGYKMGSFAFIQYNPDSTHRERAFIYDQNLSVSPPTRNDT